MRADCPIAQESTLPNAQARNEPVWVFVSAPERLHTGELVMDWVQGVCREQPWRFKQGFDWASSGNSYTEDTALWDAMKPMQARWGVAMRAGDSVTARGCVNEMAPHLAATKWYASYSGKVQGALQSACQDSKDGSCVAVCIEGGCVRAALVFKC